MSVVCSICKKEFSCSCQLKAGKCAACRKQEKNNANTTTISPNQ